MKRILVVEDEASIRELVALNLKMTGWEVLEAPSAERALELIQKNPPCDVALLDIMLPGMDGFSLCETIRHGDPYIGIIMASAKGQESDKIRGLSIGADDYITKPFRPLVLGAKVKALIRRNKNLVLDNSDTLECGPFSYDTTTMRFYKNGEELILSSKESALLLLFMKHPQQVFTKDMIYEHVWGNTVAVDDNAIMVYINRLRGKIEDDRQNPAYILTIRGLGYRFVP